MGEGQGVDIKSLCSAQFHCEYETALKNSLDVWSPRGIEWGGEQRRSLGGGG